MACADQPVTSPSDVDGPALAEVAGSAAAVVGHPMLARINANLAAAGSKLRVGKAEAVYAAKAYDSERTSTEIFANSRTHKLPYLWVSGDPRREGRVGVTYALDPALTTAAFGFTSLPAVEVDGGGFRESTQLEVEGYIENATQAWRDQTCADAPILRVPVTAGTDPDQLDEFFLLGQGPSATYLPPADIVQAGWQPPLFFNNYTPGGANGILGVTFTFIFADDQGTADPNDDIPTDIDGNGRLDVALVEIYYNANFIWTNRGALTGIDFHWVLTHETGHALGLTHFGKVFATKNDLADGVLNLGDFKFAPKALMNAVYVTGTGDITGSDNSSFCQIWASR